MSVFFQLPMDLRERWWSAITWDEREAVEREFEERKKPAPEKVTFRQWCPTTETESAKKSGMK